MIQNRYTIVLLVSIQPLLSHRDLVAKILGIIPLPSQFQFLLTQRHLGKEFFLLQLLEPLELGFRDCHLFPGFLHLVGKIGDTTHVSLDLVLDGTVYRLVLCHDCQLMIIFRNF